MSAAPPFVSVIVPTCDRPESLGVCLRALAAASYPRERFEVIVVDDGGRADVAGSCAADGLEVRLIRQHNCGAAAARNRGAAAAKGDVLLFTDDDCRVAGPWIQALVDAINRNPDALVGGQTVNALADNPFACASQLLVNAAACPRGGPTLFINGNNLAVSRSAFEIAGGFDETFRTSAGEDRELSARFQSLGRRLVFTPDAVVEHVSPLTWRRFLRQHLNYGRAAFRLRSHPSPRIPPPPYGSARFYLDLVIAPVDRVPSLSRWRQVATVRSLLILAQAATAVGFLAEWLTPRVASRA